jgi:hypothetical protein
MNRTVDTWLQALSIWALLAVAVALVATGIRFYAPASPSPLTAVEVHP